MDDEDKKMFLAEIGQDEPGLNRLIRAAYKLLGLQTYFTAGVKEVRAWTIHIGDTGPQAAGVIHTDFEKGYIRAQTIAFDDFIAFKGEQGAKDAGKMRARRQGIRRQGWRRDELPVQLLSHAYAQLAMITVHHLNNSRSQRVLWLLEELELPYEIVHYQRDPKTMLAPPTLRAVHPLGKSPVVTTDDGLTLAESGAIVETLIERYGNGRLAPAGRHARGSCATATGCTTPKARRCRRCCSSWCSTRSRRRRCRSSPSRSRDAIAGKAKAAFVMPNIETPPELHGRRTRQERMVCRR